MQSKVVNANLIQQAYDLIQIPELIFELIHLAYDLNNQDKLKDQREYEEIFKGPRK